MAAVPPGRPSCADAARSRTEPLPGTAPAAAGFWLIEVPGPWGPTAPTGPGGSRLARDVSAALGERAATAGLRTLLIRRPGRHTDDGVAGGTGHGPAHLAAVVDTRGRGAIRWSTWTDPHDLLEADLTVPVPGAGPGARGTPPRVALVCTHGRRDLCCAVRGRAVATSVAAAAPNWQVWESTHLGGHRFAANLLALPHGELFGNLDAPAAAGALHALQDGMIDLEHHRGRCGTAPAEQAAVHHAMSRLGDHRRDAITVIGHGAAASAADGAGDLHPILVRQSRPPAARDPAAARDQPDHRDYLVTVRQSWGPPATLSCDASAEESARRLDPVGFGPLPPPGRAPVDRTGR